MQPHYLIYPLMNYIFFLLHSLLLVAGGSAVNSYSRLLKPYGQANTDRDRPTPDLHVLAVSTVSVRLFYLSQERERITVLCAKSKEITTECIDDVNVLTTSLQALFPPAAIASLAGLDIYCFASEYILLTAQVCSINDMCLPLVVDMVSFLKKTLSAEEQVAVGLSSFGIIESQHVKRPLHASEWKDLRVTSTIRFPLKYEDALKRKIKIIMASDRPSDRPPHQSASVATFTKKVHGRHIHIVELINLIESKNAGGISVYIWEIERISIEETRGAAQARIFTQLDLSLREQAAKSVGKETHNVPLKAPTKGEQDDDHSPVLESEDRSIRERSSKLQMGSPIMPINMDDLASFSLKRERLSDELLEIKMVSPHSLQQVRDMQDTFHLLFHSSGVSALSPSETYQYASEHVFLDALRYREDASEIPWTPFQLYELIEALFPPSVSMPLLQKHMPEMRPTTVTFHITQEELNYWETIDTWISILPQFSHHWLIPMQDIAERAVEVVGILREGGLIDTPIDTYSIIKSTHRVEGTKRYMIVSIKYVKASDEDISLRLRLYEANIDYEESLHHQLISLAGALKEMARSGSEDSD
jgi:hypothetical protein